MLLYSYCQFIDHIVNAEKRPEVGQTDLFSAFALVASLISGFIIFFCDVEPSKNEESGPVLFKLNKYQLVFVTFIGSKCF